MTRGLRLSGWIIVPVLSVVSLGAAGAEVPIVSAVKKSDTAAVRALIQQRADVNAPEIDGTTALHWAARRDDLEGADLLIRAGANVKAVNRYGVTPLSVAAINGKPAMIERLLKAGADPNATMGEGETVLMTVARTGNVAGVKVLLASGANVTAREKVKGQTALMWAAGEGHAAVAQTLIEAGADLNLRSDRGFSAFLFAVRDGHIEATRTLLKAGANPSEILEAERQRTRGGPSNAANPGAAPGGTSALMLAIMSAHFELASVLLDAGADPKHDGLGYTALHLISWVRKPGTGVNIQGMIGSGSMDSLTIVRQLVAAGANLNARMTKTPRNGPQSFQSFLNWIGATPFLTAARGADAPLMRLLAELGADPLLPNEDNTQPLLVVAGIGVREGREDPGTEEEVVEAIKVAIELGGDVNSVDNNGETVMHGAAIRGYNAAIQLLADSGAKVEVWNQRNTEGLRDSGSSGLSMGEKGVTPLEMAVGYHRKNGSFQLNPQCAPLFRKLIAEAEAAKKAPLQ